MQIKYLLTVDGVKVAIKFHPINRVLVLGGQLNSVLLIGTLRDNYFQTGEEVKSFVGNKRCRFEFQNLQRQKFEAAIEIIKNEGLILQPVNSFGRIMR